MATQTALALTEINKPLTLIRLPVPNASELKEDEVLVKVTAAGLAPFDQKLRDKNFYNIGNHLPAVVAGDIVGTVVHNGPNASFPLGARVFAPMQFKFPTAGGLQEYTVVDGAYAAIVPQGISDAEAALYPINALTVAMALFSAHGFDMPFPGSAGSQDFDYASQTVAIVGGGSNCGKLAVQLARIAGIGTIVAIASLGNLDELKGYGATHVVARQDADVAEQVRRIVGDELLFVFDAVGNHTLGVSLLSSAKRGILAYITSGSVVDERVAAQKRAGYEYKRVIGHAGAIPEFGRLFWEQFPIWLETRKIKPLQFEVIDGLDVDKVNGVLDQYRDGKGGVRYHVVHNN